MVGLNGAGGGYAARVSAENRAAPDGSLLRGLLPPPLACAEHHGELVDLREPPGLPAERAAIAHAVAARRGDYLVVRDCARLALAELGLPPAPIGTGAGREPLWPDGVVGSLTHCTGYRGAVLAHRSEVRAVGLDAEPHQPLPPDVLGVISRPEERSRLTGLAGADPCTHWDRLLFCAKEAVYKAWFPLTGQWLGFEHASVRFDPVGLRFSVALTPPDPVPGDTRPAGFEGRWTIGNGLVLAAVVVAG